MSDTKEFGIEGAVYFDKGKEFTINGNKYEIDSPQLAIYYLNWTGAHAGIYFSNPLRAKETIRYSPNLEDGDIEHYADDLLQDLARKYDRLRKIDSKDLKGEEKQDLQTLSEMLRAA